MDLDFDVYLDTPTLDFLQNLPTQQNADAANDTSLSALHAMMSALKLSKPLHHITRSWLMLSFVPQCYDIELIELLFSLGNCHLSTAFLCFTRYPINESTLPVQIIATAAFGALFSECPEGYDIGRWLFTDGLRMAEDILFRARPTTWETLAALLQGMIALELFGLCSGHMRSNEISEAFHQALVQILMDLQETSPSRETPEQTKLEMYDVLYHDVLVLEAYRVTLLQLQPILIPVLGMGTFDPFSSPSSNADVPDAPVSNPASSPYQQLAKIACFSYFTFAYPDDRTWMTFEPNWRPETVESCMSLFVMENKYLLRNMPSLEILLRTNLWTIRSPVEIFHGIAYEIVHKGHTRSTTWTTVLGKWRNNPNYHIMTGHVKRVLDRAEELLCPSRDFIEAPHDAFSVYLGTLALSVSQVPVAGQLSEHSEIAQQIQRGMRIVAQFRVTSANHMGQILKLVYQRVILSKAV